MPEIRPFQGVHYNPERTHGLSDVIGPPEDLPSPSHVRKVTANRPYHSLKLEFGEIPTDGSERLRERYFERWLAKGVLVRSPEPMLYVHEHRFRLDGIYRRRIGLLTTAKLIDDVEIGFRPHEGIIQQNLEVRTRLLRELRLETSPIFTLVRDQGRLKVMLEGAIRNRQPLLTGHDDQEGVHRVWKLEYPPASDWAMRFLAENPVYIADGHHRYAAAVALRDYERGRGSNSQLTDYVLTLVVSENDPGLSILPTHRMIVRSGVDWTQIRGELERYFAISIEPVADSLDPDEIVRLVRRMSRSGGESPEYLVLARDQDSLFRLRLRDWDSVDAFTGQAGTNPLQRLDVSVLHGVVLEGILDVSSSGDAPRLEFTPDAGEIVRRIRDGSLDLGFFLRPTQLDQVMFAADAGEFMPEKSTYFYPKVPAGLMMYDLGVE